MRVLPNNQCGDVTVIGALEVSACLAAGIFSAVYYYLRMRPLLNGDAKEPLGVSYNFNALESGDEVTFD